MTSSPDARKLFGLSALMLFLELTLIRWLGESVLYLSFFTNFVLLASFLGIGIGFLAYGRGDWFRFLPHSLLGMVAFVSVFPVEVDRSAAEVIFIGTGRLAGLPAGLLLPLLFVVSAGIMAMVAQRVAMFFSRFEALNAYRLDILGSLAGILSFAGLSALRARPVVWGAVIGALVLITGSEVVTFLGKASLLGTIFIMGVHSFTPGFSWSPYYRVEVERGDDLVYISVNGIPHQATGAFEDLQRRDWLTDWPYRVREGTTPPDRVLIVGAGNGIDVSFALEYGARRVDAIEIDPRIYELGVEFNPDRPYDDPRVNINIDDGRAFMQRTAARYDVVLFALPDSLTSVSGQSNLRLESYLFTVEAFERARQLLTDDGMFALYNTHRDEWIVDRLAATMQLVFGQAPCQLGTATEARVLLAVGPGVAADCPGGVLNSATDPAPVVDDRPFLYIRDRVIPTMYLWALAGIVFVSTAAIRVVGGTFQIGRYLDLFLMGAAFLLLEAKSVAQFALWFGTTWHVNVLVFTGVLLSVLFAIEVSRRRTMKVGTLYLILLASVAISWAIPGSIILALPTPVRWLTATSILFTPIFVANLVFAERFKRASSPTTAFGVNLLGAMVGGVLEYASLLVGYRSLALVVGLLYLGALWAWRVRFINIEPVVAT